MTRKYRITTPYGCVRFVHDNGDIEAKGESVPSGNWKLTGIITNRGHRVVPFDGIDEWLATAPELLYRNGTPRYTATDLDHGHPRAWGNTKYHGIKSIERIAEADQRCVHCDRFVTVDPDTGDVDIDGLPDCWDAPRRACQSCGSNGEPPGCPECSDTECSWMGVHEVAESIREQ